MKVQLHVPFILPIEQSNTHELNVNWQRKNRHNVNLKLRIVSTTLIQTHPK